MTDNEKRAHDLAIAVCTDVCHLKRQSQVDAGKTHVAVDYFEEYINAYESALEAFNENIHLANRFLLIKHVKEIGFFDVRTILEAFFFFFFLLINFAPFYSGNFGSRNLSVPTDNAPQISSYSSKSNLRFPLRERLSF